MYITIIYFQFQFQLTFQFYENIQYLQKYYIFCIFLPYFLLFDHLSLLYYTLSFLFPANFNLQYQIITTMHYRQSNPNQSSYANKQTNRHSIDTLSTAMYSSTVQNQSRIVNDNQSIIYRHSILSDQLPPLLDLSFDAYENRENGEDANIGYGYVGKDRHVDSIYIQDDNNDGIDDKNNLGQQLHSYTILQNPDPGQHMKQGKKQEQSNRKQAKLQKMALQLYNQFLSPQYINEFHKIGGNQQYKQKKSSQMLIGLLTNKTKYKTFQQHLTQSRINSISNIYSTQHHPPKDNMITGLLQCLLAKIEESGCLGNVQACVDRTGQLNFNFNNANTGTIKQSSTTKMGKDLKSKRKQLEKRLQQQDKLIEQVTQCYEDIINDYATSIKNLLNEKESRRRQFVVDGFQQYRNSQPLYNRKTTNGNEKQRVVQGNLAKIFFNPTLNGK